MNTPPALALPAPSRRPRRLLVLTLLSIVLLVAALGTNREARAFSQGDDASNTLVGYNSTYIQFSYTDYWVDSNISYTRIWDSGSTWHTRIDSLAHQTKTDTDYGTSWLYAYLPTTTFYSDAYYLIAESSLNGSCTGPLWEVWACDSGSLAITVLGDGSAQFTGQLLIGGGGWVPLGGIHASGSYFWS